MDSLSETTSPQRFFLQQVALVMMSYYRNTRVTKTSIDRFREREVTACTYVPSTVTDQAPMKNPNPEVTQMALIN